MLEKFGWSDAKVDEALPRFWRMGELVIPRNKSNAVFDDPDDNRAMFVVSGDRQLLRLSE